MIRDDKSRISNRTRLLKWKEKLREACLIRTKQCRSELLWKSRSATKCPLGDKGGAISTLSDIVSDELIRVKERIDGYLPNTFISDEEDILWEYESCNSCSELDPEEYKQLMQDMEKILHEDESNVKETGDALMEDRMDTPMFEEESLAASLYAQLHLKEDQVDIQFMRRRLSDVLKQHNSECKCQPVFCVDARLGISALYMQCSVCDAFELVL